ncbi:unnamed protein product [Absidia cylindrospora]
MSSSSSQNSIFRQQQHLYRSSHYMAKAKQPSFYTPPTTPNTHSTKDHPSNQSATTTASSSSFIMDRRKMKQFPISKLLATLEKDKLIELINDLVDANPHLQPEVDAHLPSPTTQLCPY